MRPWRLPAVFERLRSDRGEFLAELRPVVVLFVNFTGSIGAPLSPSEHSELSKCLAKARQALSEPTQIAAIAEGRALSIEQVIELASFCTEG